VRLDGRIFNEFATRDKWRNSTGRYIRVAASQAFRPRMLMFFLQLFPAPLPPWTNSHGIPPIPSLPSTPNFLHIGVAPVPYAGTTLKSPHEAGYPKSFVNSTRLGKAAQRLLYESEPSRRDFNVHIIRGSISASWDILRGLSTYETTVLLRRFHHLTYALGSLCRGCQHHETNP
jgi:hypothetical protein